MQELLSPVIIVVVIGLLAGVILTIAAKYMAVPVDERVTNVRAVLPGANCGACGFAGCDEYAEKLVHDGVKTNLCTPGGGAVASQISEVLGVAADEVVPMKAVVKCSGTCEKTSFKMDYQGPQTCEANNFLYQGRGACNYGCMGFGDCVQVCQYDAIYIDNGIAVVDKERCTGCSMCAKVCPHQIIDIVPETSQIFVGCHSKDKGGVTRKLCSAGCIGCKKCEKTCEFGAITVNDNVASIDPAKCTNCGACVGVCPTKVIRSYIAFENKEEEPA